jgi:hypothetical protein
MGRFVRFVQVLNSSGRHSATDRARVLPSGRASLTFCDPGRYVRDDVSSEISCGSKPASRFRDLATQEFCDQRGSSKAAQT